MNKPKCIILCGLDGSGKTTQSKKLSEYFEKNNIESKIYGMRYPHKLILPFAGLMRLFKLSVYPLPERKNEQGFKSLKNHLFLQRLFVQILYWDFKIAKSIHLDSYLNKGMSLILDRYVVDAIVDMMSVYDIDFSQIIQNYSKLIPINSLIIFLDIDPSISVERRGDELLEALKKRRELYKVLSKKFSIKMVNGDDDLENVHSQILKILNNF